MKLAEIEHRIATNEMSATQVFTQMMQHVSKRNDVIDDCIASIRLCELVAPGVYRIRMDEAVGALIGLKQR